MRRELTSLVAAFAVHSVLLTGASRLPARAPLASSSTIESAPIELVELDLGATATEARTAPPVLVRAPDVMPPLAPVEQPAPRIEPEAEPEPASPPEPEPEPEASSDVAAPAPLDTSATSDDEPIEPEATPDRDPEQPSIEEPVAASTELPPMLPEPVAPEPAEPTFVPSPIAEPAALAPAPAPAAPSPAPAIPEAAPAGPADATAAPGDPTTGGVAPSTELGPSTSGAPGDGWSPTENVPAPQGIGLPGVPGLGSTPVWASVPGLLPSSAGVAAPTAAPKSQPVDPEAANRVLSSTMRSRDATLGLSVPAAQIVAGTVADATRTVPVPHNTRASFEVRLAPDGRVLSTKVLTASGGDASAWDAAAKNVAASLGGRDLAMGADGARSGATIVVSVTTKHVYPAGTSRRAEIKPVCANQIINDLADAASTQPGSAGGETAGPSLFTDENGRPCIPVGVAGISDVSNLGATKQIQIQTKTQVKIAGVADLPSAPIERVDTSAPWVSLGDSTAPRPTMPFKIRRHEQKRAKKR
jgi:hypothetical protein